MLNRPLAIQAEREQLRQLVEQWNENRLDLFNLSYPTEDLEIHGVMRFYFQESKDKVSTKCIRISSTATTRAVIEALVDKFHPDLKMLSNPEYTLWEVHENGEERRLASSEKPLLVQLNWHKDDREGRFLLRTLPNTTVAQITSADVVGNIHGQKRFSRKEEKELKKKHRNALAQESKCAAEELYRALPPTTFTRTISNPEVVMKKRREKKIAAKLKDLGQGGSLKIYGYELEPSRPYVTLLVSVRDTASRILEEALQKYGINRSVEDYVLVEMVIPSSAKFSRSLSDLRSLDVGRRERIMDYDECPLITLSNRTPNPSEEVLFVVKQRSPQLPIRRTRHASLSSTTALSVGYADPQRLIRRSPLTARMHNQFAIKPCLVQLTSDGREIAGAGPLYLPFGVMDIGSDRSMGLYLEGQYIRPRHAVINYQDGVVTITSSDPNADIEVNGQRICQTVALFDGNIIGIGHAYLFRYFSAWESSNSQIGDERVNKSEMILMRLAPTPVANGGISSVSTSAINRLGIEKQMHSSDTLPALLEVREDVEDEFLHRVTCAEEDMHFKLTPAYAVYMAARHRLLFPAPAAPIADSRSRLQLFLTKASNRFLIASKHRRTKEALAFWLANSSELLNFYKQDVDLSLLSRGMPQQILAGCVESAFETLSTVLKSSLNVTLNPVRDTFLDDRSASRSMVAALEEMMRMLRHCRLNAALTIQLFSQLFYYISAMLFNWLVSPAGAPYCSRAFGVRLRTRLGYISEWAYQQGLELAAECHMDRINQAVALLVIPKTVDQISNLGATCYKLNSIQVRWLLDHVVLDVSEEPVSHELIESIVELAEAHADMMAAQDGVPVQLEEELQLQLPFLLPQDGYSPDLLRGLSPSLIEALSGLQAQALCHFFPQNHSSGIWTVHFKADLSTEDATKVTGSLQRLQESNSSVMSKPEVGALPAASHQQSQRPQNERMSLSSTNTFAKPDRSAEIVNISINRGAGGIGLSIVAAQGIGERSVGIYVKKVVNGSAAQRDGRLESGDQLLSVNGQSLIGISQEEAASKMSSSGPIVSFEVYKHAAHYNGLFEWLNNPPSTPAVQSDQFPPAGRQPVVPVGPPTVPVETTYANSQFFSRQDSVTSTASNFSSQAHFMKPARNGYPAATTTSTCRIRPQDSSITAEPQLNKNRSVSASDIYQNQADVASTMSLRSLHSQGGTPAGTFLYERYQTNSATSQRSSMPSHYRNLRPVVLQPSRPNASSVLQQTRSRSPSHLHNNFASSTQQHSSPTLKNAITAECALSSSSSSPVTDYANLPLIEDHSAFESSFSSSSTSHPISSHLPFSYTSQKHQIFEAPRIFCALPNSREQNSFASSSSQDSLRSSTMKPFASASAFALSSRQMGNVGAVDEYPERRRRIAKKAPPVPPKRHTRRDELNEQLDQLEMKGAAMTEADRQKYRELVNELAKIRVPLPITPTLADRELLKLESPEIDASSKAEQLMERPKKLSVNEPKEKERKLAKSGGGNRVDEVTEGLEKVAVGSGTEKVPSEKHGSSPTQENSDGSAKEKGIRWDNKVAENVEKEDSVSKLIYEDDDPPEPRVQVLGTHEVYRDPRQKRLNEIEAKQHAAVPKIDGSKLGFRDKMQLFAEQIGDKTLKNRYKSSAVQREIEQAMGDS